MAEIAPDGFVHPWTRGPCPQCGDEMQLTRAAGRPYEECICDSCEMYARGLADGRKESAELREDRDTVLALVEEIDAKARARVANLEAEIRHVRQVFRALAEGDRTALSQINEMYQADVDTVVAREIAMAAVVMALAGLDRDDDTGLEDQCASCGDSYTVQDGLDLSAHRMCWPCASGKLDDLIRQAHQVNAADVYQREVSKLRAERDALAVLLTEAAECLDKSWGDDSEDPVAAKIRAHLNAQPDVGSASSQPDRGELISEVERLRAELQAVKEENEDLRESATVHEARADEWADRFYELESELEEANLRAEMGCENPPDDCECPGCTAAAEHNAIPG